MDILKNIDESFIKQFLKNLDKNSFINYIFELFKLNDFEGKYGVKRKTYFLEECNDSVIEQNFLERNPEHIQGHNLYIPFFYPIELLEDISILNIDFSQIDKTLKYCKKIIEERESSWQFWTDGNYMMPNIAFITNYLGLDEAKYQEKLFPIFEKLLSGSELNHQLLIGSIDSFFEMSSKDALKAFNKFVEKNQASFCISFQNGNFKINKIHTEKWLSDGTIAGINTPCEPVISFSNETIDDVLKEFQSLINQDKKEDVLERFLKKYYMDIFGPQYDRIETQIWLKFPEADIASKNRRLDVFLRNSVENDWELIELKKSIDLIKFYRDVPTFKSEILNAIQQLKNYEKILFQHTTKEHFKKMGIEYFYPELRLVIGRKPNISTEQWRWLKMTNSNNIKIITYDELIKSLKARSRLYNNIKLDNL